MAYRRHSVHIAIGVYNNVNFRSIHSVLAQCVRKTYITSTKHVARIKSAQKSRPENWHEKLGRARLAKVSRPNFSCYFSDARNWVRLYGLAAN